LGFQALIPGYQVINRFKGAVKSSFSGGLKIRTTTQLGLEIVFNEYGNSGEFLGVNITGTTDTYAALQVDSDEYTVSRGSDKASAGLIYASGGTETIAAWNPDSSSTTSFEIGCQAGCIRAVRPRERPEEGP
jgi:hypothetical protein